MTRRRIAVARIWHEANSFNPVKTTLEDFQRREWTKGPEALEAARGTATELGGLVSFLDTHPYWDVTVSRCTSAPPLGPVTSEAIATITEEILGDLSGQPWDGVYLSLHGAMVAEDDLSPDYSFLAKVREAIGPEPLLAVSFDLHACLDPALTRSVDILSAYHTYPHVDMDATALRALTMLDRALETGLRPRCVVHPLDFAPLSHGMRTASGPMAELEQIATEVGASEGLLDVSLFGGFTYADTPHTRAIVTATHGPDVDPGPAVARLSTAYTARRDDFAITLPDAQTAVADALDRLKQGGAGPIALVDAADNPLSGGIGDTTALFRALVEAGTDLPVLFCFFYDPDLVARAHDLGHGARMSCTLGGRIAPEFGAPIPFEGMVERLTDGRFRNRGPMEFGREIDLGRTAVLRSGPLRVVICETCQSANDPAWCDLHGIDLTEVAIFGIKAKNHFRAGFELLLAQIVEVDCPGLAPVDMSLLPYRHVPRAFYDRRAAEPD
ncbi:M81 family metallopeptidase [Pseudooceanicola nanhaiensis]|uniref:M81 family metallopeptidase n=1 Tax=Pseudooceanicola nanhaiensis TaxID=375761 RepID=UPI001CD219BF|nr:M81 family metallopeptidase [Pseudooceanicola nanhaiensis]MCA0921548.1 M81 family metallopeptidase [Pseudooceanicola nanhaiensis]